MDCTTEIVVLAVFGALLAWELVLVAGRAAGKRWATISMVGGRRAPQINALPLAWGILGGHVFWLWPRVSSPWFAGWWVWAGTLAAVFAADLALWSHDEAARARWPAWARLLRHPGLWLLVGVALGHWTWAQRGG